VCVGDHLVGWANSSLRHPKDLPHLGDLKVAKGIVREDHCSYAFSLPDSREQLGEGSAARVSPPPGTLATRAVANSG